MIQIKKNEFLKLQGDMTEEEFAKKLNVSRTQIWRVKNNKSKVGEDFISAFKTAYPDLLLENFFNFGVTQNTQE